jgi:hypothetical protein
MIFPCWSMLDQFGCCPVSFCPIDPTCEDASWSPCCRPWRFGNPSNKSTDYNKLDQDQELCWDSVGIKINNYWSTTFSQKFRSEKSLATLPPVTLPVTQYWSLNCRAIPGSRCRPSSARSFRKPWSECRSKSSVPRRRRIFWLHSGYII